MNDRLHHLILGCGFAAVGSLLLPPGSAHACSYVPTCKPPVRLFAGDTAVPGNMVFFRLRDRSDMWGPAQQDPSSRIVDFTPPPSLVAPSPGPLILRTRDGRVIPASTRMLGGREVFGPDEELPGGLELELEYTPMSCPSDDQQGPQIFSFSTREPVPYETGSGELSVSFSGRPQPDSAESVVKLRYMPPDFGASQHLIEYHATVDGLEVGAGGREIQVRTHCEVPDRALTLCGYYDSFPFGTHEVVAWSTRVGDDERLAVARLTVETNPKDCQEEAAPEAEPVDETEEMSAVETESEPKAGDGCTLSPGRPRPRGALAFTLANLTLLALGRRTRGREA